MSMGNVFPAKHKHSHTMASKQTPPVGINHTTVIPTNLTENTDNTDKNTAEENN